MSALKIIAIVLFVVSVILAVLGGQIMNPLLWAFWSFAVLSVFAGVIP
jgi:hypothetical protein